MHPSIFKCESIIELKGFNMTIESKHDKVADIYDRIRPSYPKALIDQIVVDFSMNRHINMLEIGAGTGKATIPMAQMGHTIDCIELGANLADLLKEKCKLYPNVKVSVSSFESWQEDENKKYDLIYSAQAFHWIDPKVKYKKCHDLLKSNGKLALFWYEPMRVENELTKSIRKVFTDHDPEYFNSLESKACVDQTIHSRRSELIQSNLFGEITSYDYMVENSLSIDEYISAVKSVAKFANLDEGVQTNIIDDLITLFRHYNCVKIPSLLKYYLYLSDKK